MLHTPVDCMGLLPGDDLGLMTGGSGNCAQDWSLMASFSILRLLISPFPDYWFSGCKGNTEEDSSQLSY